MSDKPDHLLARLGQFLLALLVSAGSLQGQAISESMMIDTFFNHPNLPRESVATSDDITAMYYNPAGIASHPLQLGYYYGGIPRYNVSENTAFLNIFGLAFSGQWRQSANNYISRYSAGTAGGNRSFSIGATYSWFNSDIATINNLSQWNIGILVRPFERLSLGAVARQSSSSLSGQSALRPQYLMALSLRPLPNPESLTLSADTTIYPGEPLSAIKPRFLVEAQPWQGMIFYGGWDISKSYFAGLKLSQNISQLSVQNETYSDNSNMISGGLLLSRERFKSRFETMRRYLRISLEQPFQEEKQNSFLFLQGNVSFYELLQAIRRAENDNFIPGILLTGSHFKGGWGQAEELRNALDLFHKRSGKPVIAFLESGSTREYYIASAAEKIYMPPAGMLELNGLKADLYFVRNFFEKVGIKADFIQIGDYKSAPETYTRNQPSEYSREQMEKILHSILAEVRESVMTSRKLKSSENFEQLLDTAYFTANQAREKQLVDEIDYLSDLAEKLKNGEIMRSLGEIKLNDYLRSQLYDDSWSEKGQIALLVLEGEIVSGNSRSQGIFSSGSIGSDSISEIVQKLKNDSSIKGVVIRINSPGGSGLASDIIWKEIQKLQKEKPVIVSLGNTAASGGYYVAMGGSEILANKTTLTGSIGVFMGKFNIKGLYDWLGVNKTTLATHPKATMFSETDSFSEAERALLSQQLQEFYEIFLQRVKQNRKALNLEQVKQNAGGRVYTGQDAQTAGMVDQLGGLALAVELMRLKTGLREDNMSVVMYPSSSGNLLKGSEQLVLPSLVREAARLMSRQENLRDEKMLFLLPYEVDIR